MHLYVNFAIFMQCLLSYKSNYPKEVIGAYMLSFDQWLLQLIVFVIEGTCWQKLVTRCSLHLLARSNTSKDASSSKVIEMHRLVSSL